MDSIINKTAISARTNQKIGGRRPSAYLLTIMKDGGPPQAKLDEFLQSHHIEPDFLRADDFEAFFAARKSALLRTIREATGITLAVETVEPEPISVPFDEEDADDEAVLGV